MVTTDGSPDDWHGSLIARDREMGLSASERFGWRTGESVSGGAPYVFPPLEAFTRDRPEFIPSRSIMRRVWNYARRRIRAVRRGGQTGRPSNSPGRAKKFGEWTVFVGRDCELTRDLGEIISKFCSEESGDLYYGDSVHHSGDEAGQSVVQLRPGWSPERLRAHCYVGETLIAHTSLVGRCGGPRRLARLSAHGRALVLSEHAFTVTRIPRLLYASSYDQRMPAVDVGEVRDHCRRTGIEGTIEISPDGGHAVLLRHVRGRPSVCVVIPTKGTSADVFGSRRVLAVGAIESLLRACDAVDIEIVVVFDQDTPPGARDEILRAGGGAARAIEFDGPFNFARKINVAAVRTDAEFLLLLNDDVEIESPDLLDVLLGYMEDDTVGLVAPLLKFEDGTVQSAGHLLNPAPFDLYRGFPLNSSAGYGVLGVAREVSSVIAAVAITRRSDFLAVGGLCEDFPGDYNDVDFALKALRAGYRNIWTPFARLWHFESLSRDPSVRSEEYEELYRRWGTDADKDVYTRS
ncbi:MAG: glycosyltransferase [Actinobacteria bacterium]|nr:glycosyltransferase [Actinomycetota bacterium]